MATMTDTRKVLGLMEQAAARARGEQPRFSDEDPMSDDLAHADSEGVRVTRERLAEAAAFSKAGTQLPAEARLKPVKQAILTFVRPVTSHQVPFNEQLVRAVESLALETERLSGDVELQERRSNRLQAAVSTADLTVDDLNDSVKRLTTELEGLADVVDGMKRLVTQELASLRSDVQTVRARQDLIFRAAREALPGGYDVERLSDLTRELGAGYDGLYEDLEDTFREPASTSWRCRPSTSTTSPRCPVACR